MEIVSAVPEPECNRVRVVKELTEDDGTKSFALHIVPNTYTNYLAAELGIDDPAEALDVTLYAPHLTIADQGADIRERVQQCKQRLTPSAPLTLVKGLVETTSLTSELDIPATIARMQAKGIDSRYWPIAGMQTPQQVLAVEGNVCTSAIIEIREEMETNNGPTEPVALAAESEVGREGASRTDVLLGVDPGRGDSYSDSTDASIQ